MDLSAHQASLQRLMHPGPFADSLAQSMVLGPFLEKGRDEMRALMREQGEGLLWEWPVFLCSVKRKRCVSVSCGLWGRHFPRGGLLKGRTSTGEEMESDRAFLEQPMETLASCGGSGIEMSS